MNRMKSILLTVIILATISQNVLAASGSINITSPEQAFWTTRDFFISGTFVVSSDSSPNKKIPWGTSPCPSFQCPNMVCPQAQYCGCNLQPYSWSSTWGMGTYAELHYKVDGQEKGLLDGAYVSIYANDLGKQKSFGTIVSIAGLDPAKDHTVTLYFRDVYGVYNICYGSFSSASGDTFGDTSLSFRIGAAECKDGDTKPCYTGPDVTRNVPICKDGIKSCKNGRWDTVCVGEVLPQPEICGDGLDNDCNGKVDDGCCDVKVTKNPGSQTVDPAAGGTVNLSATVTDSSKEPISWKIILPNGIEKTGNDRTPSATWDGKDSAGKYPNLLPNQSTTVSATVSAWHTDDPTCKDSQNFTITLTMNKDCKLDISWNSSANAASGNLSHNQNLFSTKGAGFAASMTLYYNSLDPYSGPLGTGWTHNYDITIGESSDGYVIMLEGNGGRKIYTRAGSSYISQPGDSSVLTKNTDNTFVLTYKDGMIYNFNQGGKIASMVDRNGNALTFNYTNGNLSSMIDPAGRITALRCDSAGHITSITDPGGGSYAFAVTNNMLLSITYPDNGRWSYTYDSNAFMLSKTDPNGNTATYSYDSGHRVVSSIDAEGRIKSVAYPAVDDTSLSKSTTVTETDGGIWQYAYDTGAGTLTSKTDPNGNSTSYTYDQNRNMLTKTDQDGSATTYTYDAGGNMTSTTDALGQTTSYTYNGYGQVTSIIDPEGNATTNTYDDKGNLTATADLTGASTSYDYDSRGNVTKVTNAAGQSTVYTYDQQNNRISMTDSTGAITSFTYDTTGNMTSQKDANGNTTRYEYDNNNRLIKVTDQASNVTTFGYDANGNRTSQTDANGIRTFYEYNSKGQLVSVKDALGNATTYAYGGAGCSSCGGGGDKLIAVTDANGNTIRYEYDQTGRKIKELDALGNATSFTYDSKGNILTRTDANGHVTSYVYDPLSRVTVQTDALLEVIKFAYTSKGQISKVIDPLGNITAYEYDASGRVVKVVSPDTGTTSYTYNATSTLASKTDSSGTTIKYQYDNLSRLTTIDFSTDVDTTYTYDDCINGKGRVCTMTDQSGNTSYQYDKLGRVVKETKTILDATYTTNYAYDKSANITTITYPSGRTVNYSYNSVNRPASVTQQLNRSLMTVASSFMYDKIGNTLSMTFGNGLTQNRTYDPDNRIATIAVYGTMNNAYTYDPAGNITAINDQLVPVKSRTFTYDPLDRLATALGPWGSLAWTYDSNGNRLSQTNGVQHKYTYDANRLRTVSNGHIDYYQYDSNGNMTRDMQKNFVYNQNQRLIKATESGKTLSEYVYNGNGQRVIKKSGPANTISASSQNTIYHYDLSGKLIAETAGNGRMISEYVYLAGQPIAIMTKQANNERMYYYHNDHLGTPQKMTDSSGTVVWAADYKPFGEATVTVSTITNNLRFPGQYFDAETGLNYNYFRDYNPMIGRFLQADPLGIQEGVNHLFSYTANNPINYEDPDGLCPGRLDLTDGNRYTMGRPSRANNYQYQRLTRESRVGRLTSSSGDCNCQNRTLTCNYDIFESWHTRTRSYNRRTRQYGSWGPWDGYDDRLIGRATTQYNCQDDTYTITGVQRAN